MNNFDLVRQILAGRTTDVEEITVNTNFVTNAVRIQRTLGPIMPRTRIVTLTPKGEGHEVSYSEIAHGMPQEPTVTQVDTTSTADVTRLMSRIWTHLKG